MAQVPCIPAEDPAQLQRFRTRPSPTSITAWVKQRCVPDRGARATKPSTAVDRVSELPACTPRGDGEETRRTREGAVHASYSRRGGCYKAHSGEFWEAYRATQGPIPLD